MIYYIDNIKIDTDRYLIVKMGEPVAVEPLTFDLIEFLIQHRDRVVTRRELLDTLWAGRVVGDATLSNQINAARCVLGDDGERQKIIKTVRGRGYQFIGPLSKSESQGSLRKHRFPALWLAPIALVLLALGVLWSTHDRNETNRQSPSAVSANKAVRSIAVLPLSNRSESLEDKYFALGIHDDLLTQVSKISGIKTISQNSVLEYKNTEKDLKTIAGELGVNTLLEGSVQRAGDMIRINIRVIDVQSDSHMWAQSYTRELTAHNIFSIQSEISLKIASSLQSVLAPDDMEEIRRIPTQNLDALTAWLKGSELRASGSKDLLEASTYFRKAIEHDPYFAEAYVELAQALVDQIWTNGVPKDKQIPLAEPLLNKALELNPGASQAYVVLGEIRYRQARFQESVELHNKAISINANNANAWYNLAITELWGLGLYDKALRTVRKAVELDPVNHSRSNLLGEALLAAGEYAQAKSAVENALKHHPENIRLLRTLGEIQSWAFHRNDLAIKTYHKALAIDPANIPLRRWLSLAYIRLGDQKAASFWLQEAIDLSPGTTIYYPEDLGIIEYVNGNLDSAMAHWRRSQNHPSYISNHLYLIAKWEMARGNTNAALELYRSRVPNLERDTMVDSVLFSNLTGYAEILMMSGDQEKARRLLERASPLVNKGGSVIHRYFENHLHYLALLERNDDVISTLQHHYKEGRYFDFDKDTLAYPKLSMVHDQLNHRADFRNLVRLFEKRREHQRSELRQWKELQ